MNSIVYEYLSNHSVPWMFTSAAAHVDIIGMKFCFDVLKSAEANQVCIQYLWIHENTNSDSPFTLSSERP